MVEGMRISKVSSWILDLQNHFEPDDSRFLHYHNRFRSSDSRTVDYHSHFGLSYSRILDYRNLSNHYIKSPIYPVSITPIFIDITFQVNYSNPIVPM
ncbi:hypothetical protein TNCT_547111 [Trichonephila clavata]|uniref:Uncharacterized protein n=1 Tax=Trichonephila clavata TaxID=2740835 RepID=A0A8X6M116_TRICU|nr:hypothetical protein TNCT_547111 [Trichonephila clavata]